MHRCALRVTCAPVVNPCLCIFLPYISSFFRCHLSFTHMFAVPVVLQPPTLPTVHSLICFLFFFQFKYDRTLNCPYPRCDDSIFSRVVHAGQSCVATIF